MLEWLIFVSATLGTVFQGRRAVQGWLYDRADRREARRVDRAGWSAGGVDTWTAQLGPCDPDAPQRSATVAVTVCGKDGTPSPDQADRLRRYLEEHDRLSRNPTPGELETLTAAARDGGRLDITRARRRRLVPRAPGA
jgi:hypothetical protein